MARRLAAICCAVMVEKLRILTSFLPQSAYVGTKDLGSSTVRVSQFPGCLLTVRAIVDGVNSARAAALLD
jgi:hypothetical protein